MGFRATQFSTDRAFQIFIGLQQQEYGALRYLMRLRQVLKQPLVPEENVGDLRDHCARLIERTDQWVMTPGLAAMAKRILADTAFELEAEWLAVRTALAALHDAAVALNPRSGRARGADPSPSGVAFSALEVAPVLEALEALILAHRR